MKLTAEQKSNLEAGLIAAGFFGVMIGGCVLCCHVDKKEMAKRAIQETAFREESHDILKRLLEDLNDAKCSLSPGAKKYVFKEVMKVISADVPRIE